MPSYRIEFELGSDEEIPAQKLYSTYVETGEQGSIASKLWGRIPVNLAEAHELAVQARRQYGNPCDSVEELKRGVKRQMRDWGVLTSVAEERIDGIDAGVVETGHQ